MKKVMATAGKTAVKFIAEHEALFTAAILGGAVLKLTLSGLAGLDRTVAVAASLTVLLLYCVLLTQKWKIQRLLSALDNTIDERDHAEQQLQLERIGAHSPMSWDELAQLKDDDDADPIRVQLAWMRHRAEQAEAQQQATGSK